MFLFLHLSFKLRQVKSVSIKAGQFVVKLSPDFCTYRLVPQSWFWWGQNQRRQKKVFFFFECLYFCVQNYNLTSASVPQRHMEVFLTQLLLTFIYIITSCDSIVSMGPYTKDSQGDPPNRSSPLCYEHKMKTMKHNITTITIDFRNTAHRPWSLQILCSHMLHI